MGRVSRRRTTGNLDEIEEQGWVPAEINNEETLTLLGAVCQVVEVVRDSQNDPRIYEAAARPIAYITDKLGLTKQQAVVYAILMDIYYDKEVSTFDIAHCMGISPIKAIIFGDDIEELCQRKYLVRVLDNESPEKIYSVTREAIDSLQNNQGINYATSTIESAEQLFNAIDKAVIARCHGRIDYSSLCRRIEELIMQNQELQVVKRYMTKAKSLCEEDRMLFLWICNMVVSDSYEVIVPDNFKKLYDDLATYRAQRKSLATGTNALIRMGLLRVAKSGEQRSKNSYELTSWVIKDMLADLQIELATTSTSELISHSSITAKPLFYNPREQKAIDQLSSLLQPERFAEVCNALQNRGFRKGFACLFYGAPGTGKTETVLQLARATGRNLMQVNISEIKSMWVGESEKNVKAIFSRYRKMVEESEVAPILLFNEADAVIGKRLEGVARSVDKMENAMQNIILEEIEKLDGILIATTNLTSNLDAAFERRFLYKVEFEQPSVEVKCSIWQSMISDLSADDAAILAAKYNFSGGQIENIARKSVVDQIITGETLSLDALIRHCNSEQLGRGASRNRIGF